MELYLRTPCLSCVKLLFLSVIAGVLPGVVGCISRICLLVVGYRQVQLSGSVVASQLSYLNKVMVSHLQFVLSVGPATFTAGTEGWGQELLHALCHVLCAKTFYFGSFTPTTKMPNLNGIEKGVSDRCNLTYNHVNVYYIYRNWIYVNAQCTVEDSQNCTHMYSSLYTVFRSSVQ